MSHLPVDVATPVRPAPVRRLFARASVVLAATAALLVGAAGLASAHVPVILTPANSVLDVPQSPRVPTGTDSFAFYGKTGFPGDTRVVRAHLNTGEEFHAELLIPALKPETRLANWQLPRMTVVAPNGAITVLPNSLRRYFYEPYTRTEYYTLAETTLPAVAGDYTVIVAGVLPTRFVTVTGTVEKFPAPVENAKPDFGTGVPNWYATPATWTWSWPAGIRPIG